MDSLHKVKKILNSVLKSVEYPNKQPIFILGTGRCGSTLLVDILNSNPQIDITQKEYYDIFLPALKKGRKHSPVFTDLVNFEVTARESLKYWNRKFYRIKMKVVFDNLLYDKPQKTFIIKSPAMTFVVKKFAQLYPKAKYIHLYRNGYSTSLSWAKKNYYLINKYQEEFTKSEFLYQCANYYNSSILEITSFLKPLPENNKFSLSYEELTKNPYKQIEDLSHFLGVKNKYDFDFSIIKNMNFKQKALNHEQNKTMGKIIRPAHQILGYNIN